MNRLKNDVIYFLRRHKLVQNIQKMSGYNDVRRKKMSLPKTLKIENSILYILLQKSDLSQYLIHLDTNAFEFDRRNTICMIK